MKSAGKRPVQFNRPLQHPRAALFAAAKQLQMRGCSMSAALRGHGSEGHNTFPGKRRAIPPLCALRGMHRRLVQPIIRHWLILLAGLLAAPAIAPAQSMERWVDVNAATQTVAVMDGTEVKLLLNNVSFGRGGVGTIRRQGDGITPVGQFRIAWINRNSRYHLFLGLDFPNLDVASQALNQQMIDDATYNLIKTAVDRDETPPQNTSLGGYIGIHGVGRGDPRIHDQFNWTDGCVALTNQQIEQLAQHVNIGTRVIIHR